MLLTKPVNESCVLWPVGTESRRFLAVPQSTIHNSDESAKSADKSEYAKFEMKEGTDILNMLLPNPDNFADDDFQGSSVF